MNEMVERVAQALSIADGMHPDAESNDEDSTPAWTLYVEDAKAAIAAMKGATEPMKEAGAHSSLTLMASYGGDGAFDYVSEENAGEIFDKMIDEALKE